MKLFSALSLSLLCITFISGCSSTAIPKGITPVNNFELNRYLGKWYEIARLDNRFERGLEAVTAEYSVRPDGGVKVLNSGYSATAGKRKQSEGKAYFVGQTDTGHLKVSFFGPFYASYVIFELDQDNYQYAFVSGNDRSYLWFLSRTPTVSPELKAQFLEKVKALGFASDKVLFVNHQANP